MRLSTAAVLVLLSATAAVAQPELTAEIGRGAAAVSLSTSEAPALRAERVRGEPSAGFLLGAAYRAWSNAAAVLAFDLANPTAAGPAHASQNGAVSDFIREECKEEAVAFDALVQRLPLGLDITRVISAAAGEAADVGRWTDRKAGPAPACR